MHHDTSNCNPHFFRQERIDCDQIQEWKDNANLCSESLRYLWPNATRLIMILLRLRNHWPTLFQDFVYYEATHNKGNNNKTVSKCCSIQGRYFSFICTCRRRKISPFLFDIKYNLLLLCSFVCMSWNQKILSSTFAWKDISAPVHVTTRSHRPWILYRVSLAVEKISQCVDRVTKLFNEVTTDLPFLILPSTELFSPEKYPLHWKKNKNRKYKWKENVCPLSAP